MTNEDIKGMLGVEFIYKSSDAAIKAYVKAFDPDIGFSCYSLGNVTECGYVIEHVNPDEGLCLVAYNLRPERNDADSHAEKMEIISSMCEMIVANGVLNVNTSPGQVGRPKCSFE